MKQARHFYFSILISILTVIGVLSQTNISKIESKAQMENKITVNYTFDQKRTFVEKDILVYRDDVQIAKEETQFIDDSVNSSYDYPTQKLMKKYPTFFEGATVKMQRLLLLEKGDELYLVIEKEIGPPQATYEVRRLNIRTNKIEAIDFSLNTSSSSNSKIIIEGISDVIDDVMYVRATRFNDNEAESTYGIAMFAFDLRNKKSASVFEKNETKEVNWIPITVGKRETPTPNIYYETSDQIESSFANYEVFIFDLKSKKSRRIGNLNSEMNAYYTAETKELTIFDKFEEPTSNKIHYLQMKVGKENTIERNEIILQKLRSSKSYIQRFYVDSYFFNIIKQAENTFEIQGFDKFTGELIYNQRIENVNNT
ncbi:MAG: hypothetical protein ACRCWQ_02455, partial [Bacilli bacterium]